MIVHTWRGNMWKSDDLDSILSLVFSNTSDEALIDLFHTFTTDQFSELWDQVYWTPMREYLAKKGN